MGRAQDCRERTAKQGCLKVTPTEKDALDRFRDRLKDTVIFSPTVRSEDAIDRLRLAEKYIYDAITILEDGLPF